MIVRSLILRSNALVGKAGGGGGFHVYCSLITGGVAFTDIHGNEIFALKKKHFTIHKTFHAENPKGHELFVITKKFTGQ